MHRDRRSTLRNAAAHGRSRPTVTLRRGGTRTATLDPTALRSRPTQRATRRNVRGGASGVTDVAGNAMAIDDAGRSPRARRAPPAARARSGRARRRRPQQRVRTPRRSRSGVKFRSRRRTASSPASASTRAAEHRHPRRAPVDGTGHAARPPPRSPARRRRGWQQATFPTPVAITANTTYVASYFAPVGRYAVNDRLLRPRRVDTAPLHALRDGATAATASTATAASGRSRQHVPAPRTTGSTSSSTTGSGARHDAADGDRPPARRRGADRRGAGDERHRDIQRADGRPTITGSTFRLRDPAGTLVPAAVDLRRGDAGRRRSTPSADLADSTRYTATVSGGDRRRTDRPGNTLAADAPGRSPPPRRPAPVRTTGPAGRSLVVTPGRRTRSAATTPRSSAPRA